MVGRFDRAEVAAMAAAINHRGPDDRSVTTFEGCGFGFTRLSIIDVAEGRQPIADEKERFWIIYNGEIYNFPELREELERLGHSFRTHTDTETVLHGYEQWGVEVVHHLRGMFAFAIWDTHENELFLARDRLGIKPLYYAVLGDRMAFASEIKALLTLPDLPRDLDKVAIAQVLSQRYSIAPHTPLSAVRRLPPGHHLRWKAGALRIVPYYTYQITSAPVGSETALAAGLLDSLRDTVRRMLVSEVPVGFFLSGGLDSSAIVALASEMMPQRLLTFTSVYDTGDRGISEGSAAQLVASDVGSEHREVEVAVADVPKALPQVIWSLDEPLVDPASLSEWMLAAGTKRHATVVLVGEGADEQFGGYSNKWRMMQRRQNVASAGVGRIAKLLPTPPMAAPGRVPRAMAMVRSLDDDSGFYFDSASLMSRQEVSAVVGNNGMRKHLAEALDERKALFDAIPAGGGSSLDRFLAFDTRYNLPANILLKVDKTTMASSIEARVPYLDEVILGVAAGIPSNLKFTGTLEKYILRKAVASYLPGETAWRPKQAFRTPIGEWVRELRSTSERLLASDDTMVTSIASQEAIERVVRVAGPGNRYAAHQVWAFLSLELWLREFVRGEGTAGLSNT